MTEAEEGGLRRYLPASANGAGSGVDAVDAGSGVDGAYFKLPLSKWCNQVPKAVSQAAVISKHLRTIQIPASIPTSCTPPSSPPSSIPSVRGGALGAGMPVEGVYYKRVNGRWEHLDFGTTATCCLVLNAPDAANPYRKLCVTAHVGDSDACLFRFAASKASHASNASSRPLLSLASWLTKEHTLYAEEERLRPVPRGCLLHHLEGDHTIKWKVCIYLYAHHNTHTRAHTHTYAQAHTHTRKHTHSLSHTQTYVYVYVCICKRICLCVCVSVHTCIHM